MEFVPEEMGEGLEKVILEQGFAGGKGEPVTDGVCRVECLRLRRLP